MACFIALRADIEWKMPAVFLAPSFVLHRLHHALEVVGKLRVVMVRRRDRDIAAMIAKIEYQHVEFGQELPPVRIVRVGGEAVAVRDQKPHAVRIAVAAHQNAGAVRERNLERLARRGNFERHRRTPPGHLFHAGTA